MFFCVFSSLAASSSSLKATREGNSPTSPGIARIESSEIIHSQPGPLPYGLGVAVIVVTVDPEVVVLAEMPMHEQADL